VMVTSMARHVCGCACAGDAFGWSTMPASAGGWPGCWWERSCVGSHATS
jgi:hypothetical protein